MNFFEAITRCYNEGISIVPSRYTQEPKSRVQSYIENGLFVTQDGDDKPKNSTITTDKMKDDWEVFTGDYERYSSKHQQEIDELDELKRELEPFICKYQRYLKLKEKLEG